MWSYSPFAMYPSAPTSAPRRRSSAEVRELTRTAREQGMGAVAISGRELLRSRTRSRYVAAALTLLFVLGVPGSVPGAETGVPPDMGRPPVTELAAGNATPPAPAEPPLEELIIELRAGRVARQTIIAGFDGEQVFIPARPLFELIEIRSSIDAEGCLRAVRQPKGEELFVDAQLGLARVRIHQLNPERRRRHIDVEIRFLEHRRMLVRRPRRPVPLFAERHAGHDASGFDVLSDEHVQVAL